MSLRVLPVGRQSARSFAARSLHSTSIAREHVLNATPEQFSKQLSAGGDKIVLVDFYADWCGPCRMLTPILKQVVAPTSSNIDLMTVDTDEHQDLALKYKVRALPTVVAFRNGEAVGQFVGARDERGVRAFLSDIGA